MRYPFLGFSWARFSCSWIPGTMAALYFPVEEFNRGCELPVILQRKNHRQQATELILNSLPFYSLPSPSLSRWITRFEIFLGFFLFFGVFHIWALTFQALISFNKNNNHTHPPGAKQLHAPSGAMSFLSPKPTGGNNHGNIAGTDPFDQRAFARIQYRGDPGNQNDRQRRKTDRSDQVRLPAAVCLWQRQRDIQFGILL